MKDEDIFENGGQATFTSVEERPLLESMSPQLSGKEDSIVYLSWAPQSLRRVFKAEYRARVPESG